MKFFYGDTIKVIAGFYTGCVGTVVDYSKATDGTVFYNVTITNVIYDGWKTKVCKIQEDCLQNNI
jgi:ribosomal protein L24